jgi:hypothetical protein
MNFELDVCFGEFCAGGGVHYANTAFFIGKGDERVGVAARSAERQCSASEGVTVGRKSNKVGGLCAPVDTMLWTPEAARCTFVTAKAALHEAMVSTGVAKALYWFGEGFQAVDEIRQVIIVYGDSIVFGDIDLIVHWLHLA